MLSLEYASDLSYHDLPSAGEDRIIVILIGDFEVHPNASEPEVLMDAPMEESEGELTEDWLMSPLDQEEEVPIVPQEEFDLMIHVLDDQPILGSSVSGHRVHRRVF